MKDLKRLSPCGQTRTARELLNMRAAHHIILVIERPWDNQIELIDIHLGKEERRQRAKKVRDVWWEGKRKRRD